MCLTYSTDFYRRITLESWFTNLKQTAPNRCQPLPAPYKRLLNRKQYHIISYSFSTKTITWLWRWLSHRWSKHQSQTTVHLKTPITQMIFFNQGMRLLRRHFSPGACFSKVPKLFGRISGDIILFVSSKRRRLEARNFAIIFTFTPFTTYEKISFTE